jgi:pyruvate,water dikinase
MAEEDSRGVPGSGPGIGASGTGLSGAGAPNAPEGSEYVVWLDGVDMSGSAAVGEKVANIGELIKTGLPVPPGFALTAKAFNRFLGANKIKDKIDSILANVSVGSGDGAESVKSASADIMNIVMRSHIPDSIRNDVRNAYEELSIGKEIRGLGGAALDMIKAGRGQVFVAVRSSVVTEQSGRGLSGQLESRLCVQGNESLYDAIKRCWAGMFSGHAIFYMKSKGIESLPGMGIVVQKMIDADRSGTIITADPVHGGIENMLVEAAWGYGDSISSGLVTPDEYAIGKESGSVEGKVIGKKKWRRKMNQVSGAVITENVDRSMVSSEVLAEPELRRLLELGRRVEDHWGTPQEIRWAAEKGRFYLVQTRPVVGSIAASSDSDGTEVDGNGQEAGHENNQTTGKMLLEGAGVSLGSATGAVKVVSGHETGKIEAGSVLVTKTATPAMIPWMKDAAAVITNDGGKTCYAAAMSRELGIPCIVGTDMATTVLNDGQKVVVNASKGMVYEFVEPPEPAKPPEPAGIHQPHETHGLPETSGTAPVPVPGAEARPDLVLPSMTVSSEKITATGIKANITFPQSVENGNGLAARSDGAGLVRAEHILTESGKHPVFLARTDPDGLVETIASGLGKVAKAFYPKPVWYRCLDARTDEFRELEGGGEDMDGQQETEANPMLGWHGARRSIGEPSVFKCELRAIKRLHENGMDNVAVMLPFVSRAEEVRAAREIMNQLDTKAKLGVMIETPAAALEIEQLCREGIAFASIGSNSLVQLTLGIDRENPKVAGLYSETDPAVLDLIKYVIKVCRKYGVETSICGQAGSNPVMAEMLVGLGIDSISAEPDAIDEIRKTAAKAERRMLLERTRQE